MSDTEDLSARARRGQLDEAERRRLDRLLETSLEARLLHRAGAQLDAEDLVLRGDDELTERVVARVLEARGTAHGPRFRRRHFVAAAVFASAAAAAAVPLARSGLFFRAQTGNSGLPRQMSADGPATRSGSASTTSANRAPLSSSSAAESLALPGSGESPPASAPPEGSSTGRVGSPHVGRETSATGAAELFAEANRARREGRPADAISLYRAVQIRYPKSAESVAAALALGVLELQHGNPDAALRNFQRYLDAAPNGDLAPEALWGKASALAASGRVDEARETWALIAERHPSSAYAKAAKAKLGAGASSAP